MIRARAAEGARPAGGRRAIRAAALFLAVPVVASVAGCRAASRSVAPQRVLDLDWIHGPEADALDETVRFAWTTDGRILTYDRHAPEGERGLFRLDPRSGAHPPAFDARAAAAGLEALLPPDAPGGTGAAEDARPGWPAALSADGARSVHVLAGDLWLLDHATSTWRRLTESPEALESVPRLSPDGRRLSFVRENDLRVLDLASGAERRLTDDGSDDVRNGTLSWVYWEEVFGRQDLATWWSPDSRRLAFLRTDETGVDRAYFVDYEPAAPRLVTQRYPKAGSRNPSVRVGIADVETGALSFVDLDPAACEYVVRVDWTPDGAALHVQTMTRDQRSLDLWRVPAGGGAPRRVLRETDPAWVDVTNDLRVLSDGRLLWTSQRTGSRQLYLLDADGRELARLTDGPAALVPSTFEGSSVAAVDEARGWVYVTGLLDSSIERHLYRVPLAGGAAPERVTDREGTHRVSFSPDASLYLDEVSDIGTPPSLELRTAAGELVRVVQPPRLELLAGLDLAVPRFLELPARDGFALPAWLLEPPGLDRSEPRPLVLYVYGGPSAPVVRNAWSNALLFDQLLLREGYLVARIDNRSATGISKTLENTVLGCFLGQGERDDLVDGVRALKALPEVDPDRVGVWGWSGGGSMTLHLMTSSDEFRAGVAVAAVTDWRYYDTIYTERAMKTPAEDPEGYRATAVAARAKELHGRLLLVHGTQDDNVHPQNALRFADELVSAGIPFDLMVYPLRNHPMRRAGEDEEVARRHLFAKMLEFWRLYL